MKKPIRFWEINYDWKPLCNASGTAVNTTHITSTGEPGSGLSAYAPEEVTVLDKAEFVAHLGPYSVVDATSAVDDIFLSVIPSNRSSGKKTDVTAGTYPSVNANPFYPAVAGTHKNYTDEENEITGTQPGALGDEDIYAGGYQHVEVGAVDPAGKNFRYIIQNDLQWTYATNPFAAGGAGESTSDSVGYKTPQATAYATTYTGYTTTLNTQLDSITNDTPSGDADADRTAANFQLAGVASIGSAGVGNTPVDTTLKVVNATSGLYGSIVIRSTYTTTESSSYISYSVLTGFVGFPNSATVQKTSYL